MKTTYIIIAAGEATRWNNYLNRPKHLAPILGEPIIHRTQRLIAPYLKAGDEAYVVVKEPKTTKAYLNPNSPFKLRKARLTPANGDADKIVSSKHLWDTTGRTVIIWGDTYLTDITIKTIATTTPEKWVSISRWGANPYTGAVGGENFAHIITPDGYSTYTQALNRVIKLYKENIIPRNGGWEIYKALNNLPDEEIFKRLDKKGSTHNPKLSNAIEIIDGSEDFDGPKDWDNWCYNWSVADQNTRNIMKHGTLYIN